MEPILTTATQVVGQQTTGQTTPGSQRVSVVDQARFEQSLNGNHNQVTEGGTPAPEKAQAASEVPADGTVIQESLGDAILRGIESIKNQYDTRAGRIASQLVEMERNPQGLQDVMKVQFELMQLNMQQELTSKLADKTSQGVQTLFRNQG